MNERLRPQVSDDFVIGELVRRRGIGGTGIIESIASDGAWVAWDGDHRDFLPFGCLRRAFPRGEEYDVRRR